MPQPEQRRILRTAILGPRSLRLHDQRTAELAWGWASPCRCSTSGPSASPTRAVYTGRQAVVVLGRAYHGRTLLTMSMTAKNVPYKQGFGPFAPEVYRASLA